MKTWTLISCTMAMTLATNAWAYSVEEKSPFAALQWTFGAESMKPDVVVGYRSVDVDTSGDVSGWQASASYKAHEGVDKLKLEGVTGDKDIQFTYGGGYSLQQKKALLSASANGEHVVVGADYVVGDKGVDPFFGVTTIGTYDVPEDPATKVDNSTVETVSTVSHVDETTTAPVNDDLQAEYFPEYTDCTC
ncbi:hypothetical protein EOL70_01630 [Leucothrix sargassi]|nr:hypothetical protein EOL70_01630 [Leucothrix sargassi]